MSKQPPIDWKVVCQSEGYKSLMNAYNKDVRKAVLEKRPMRKKEEFKRLLQWVICRAKHYSHHTGKPVQVILNEWEEKRTCWWLGCYGNSHKPKFHSDSLKTMTIKGISKFYKNDRFYSALEARNRTHRDRLFMDKESSKRKGRKARWTNDRKAQHKRMKRYEKELKEKEALKQKNL